MLTGSLQAGRKSPAAACWFELQVARQIFFGKLLAPASIARHTLLNWPMGLLSNYDRAYSRGGEVVLALTRRLLTRIIVLVFLFIVIAATAFFLLAPVRLPGGITLSFGNKADAILRQFAPDEAFWRQIGTMETSPRDGPSPEMAQQSYELVAPAAELRTGLRAACADNGLAPPQTPRREGGSDLICTGQMDGGQVDVFLSLDCEDPTCKAALWVHAY